MLNILYRCSPHELESPPTRQGRPSWFSKKACFNSLHASLQKNEFKDSTEVLVIADGGRSALTQHIEEFGYPIQYIDANSNLGSLKIQIELSKQVPGDVYFLEDDYLHLPDAISNIVSAVASFGLVTGYDHIDRYTRTDDIEYKQQIYLSGTRHWRVSESTTGTFAIRRDLLNSAYPLIDSVFSQGMDRLLFRQLHAYNYRLFSAMPGLTTHVHEPYMSPFVDWQGLSESCTDLF